MTKQEQIEEISTYMKNCSMRGCVECNFLTAKGGCSKRARAEALYNAGYCKAEEVRKETAKEILQKLESLAADRYDYFGKLRAKNLEHNGYIQDSDANYENATFDLGEMDAFNCIIDKIKQLAKEYRVKGEVKENEALDR